MKWRWDETCSTETEMRGIYERNGNIETCGDEAA